MPLAAGTRLGPYEVTGLLGAGGMGEVYKARDSRLDRTVAVKVLPPHFAQRADLRQRFEREAKALSSLSHPHICILHDIGKQDGADYLVMEFLQDETLGARLKRGPLPIDQALRFAIQMIDALDCAHKHTLIHRDLKPGNVMITEGIVKLLDFGLAKARPPKPAETEDTLTEALTTAGAILGTPQYMAPEQLGGEEEIGRASCRERVYVLV